MLKSKKTLFFRPVLILLTFSLLLLSGILIPGRLYASETPEPSRKIRVGFPIQAGLTQMEPDGKLSGYTYEYLQEIAQYTGWEYEFVQLPGDINDVLNKMLKMLADGELDILGGLAYHEQLTKQFDFPGNSYGTAHTVLYALKTNTSINENNFHSIQNLRVSVMKGAKTRLEELALFCESSGISVELVECADTVEALNALYEGRADLMLGRDLALVEDARIVVQFAPQPFYFATTKGNNDIVNALNMAITRINEANPYFSAELYEKYFQPKAQSLLLNDVEQQYVQEASPLNVAVITGKAPIQDLDPVTGELRGISMDVLEDVASAAGLKMSYHAVSNFEEYQALRQSGSVQLVAGVPYDYEAAALYQVSLTEPYLSTQVVMAVNNRNDRNDLHGKRLALPEGYIYPNEFIGKATWFNTVHECLEAVARWEQDYCYGNGYSIQYYSGAFPSNRLTLIPQSGEMLEFSIGVVRPADINLLTILNKVLHNLTDSELQSIIYRNTYMPPQITLTSFLESNPRQAILLLSAVALTVIFLLLFLLYTRIRAMRRMELDNRRYAELAELSNEYLYEYDIKHDTLHLSAKCVKAFGGNRQFKRYRESLKERIQAGEESIQPLLERLESLSGGPGELLCNLPDGSRRWLRVTSKIVQDASGKPVSLIGKVADIQEEKTRVEDLKDQAMRDSLTRVYNAASARRLISETLDCGENPECGTLFIIDIDYFKEVNDRFGHYTGDQILIAVAGVLVSAFRKQDVVGRLGGDEFVIFMRNTTDPEIVAKKCRLMRHMAWELPLGDSEDHLTLSIGAAVSDGRQTFIELYKTADHALYTVKNRGRDGFEIAGGAMELREE